MIPRFTIAYHYYRAVEVQLLAILPITLGIKYVLNNNIDLCTNNNLCNNILYINIFCIVNNDIVDNVLICKVYCIQELTKTEKIHLAMQKIKEANIKKVFIKVFDDNGGTKTLLIDERMRCSFVMKLLANKHHITLEPRWAIIEHLPELHMGILIN